MAQATITRPSSDQIKHGLVNRFEDVIATLRPRAVVIGKVAYCSYESPKNMGSWQAYLRDNGKFSRGHWNRWSEGVGGDAINFCAYCLTGAHRGEEAYSRAFEWAYDFLGIREARPLSQEEITERELRARYEAEERERNAADLVRQQGRKVEIASEIWRSANQLDIASARYFDARGLDASHTLSSELRFHPSLWNAEAKRCYPAIVALVRDAQGKGKAIWRIYLASDGRKKALLEDPKVGLAPAGGGAVRLGGLSSKIGIAEGIETALACAELIDWKNPVWSGLNTSGLIGFQCPSEVQDVTIYADADMPRRKDFCIVQPGLDAAEKLRARLLSEGKTCRIQLPPIGMDFLDLLNLVKKREKVREYA